MKMKKVSLQKRKEYVEALYKIITEQQRVIELIESYVPQSLEARIIHEYAIEGSVTVVANKLNEEGIRLEGRKYISNDITSILLQKPKDDLYQITQEAFKHNKAGVRY
ncbi:hypothetical protein ACHHV8_13875 [Paenibacillus sp. TAB 01]|uniref:hypothetical protein n=1 Tax=Paenibacillus sp. TAB 01 TaxID=3368988 RepID=UPI0037526CCD